MPPFWSSLLPKIGFGMKGAVDYGSRLEVGWKKLGICREGCLGIIKVQSWAESPC